MRWIEFLCEYDFDVHYIKEKENVVTDTLSRRCNEISSMIIERDTRERILHHLPEYVFYVEIFQLVHSKRPLEGIFSDFSLVPD